MADLSDLARAVSGRVLLPADDGYVAACTGFNLAVVPRPDAIVRVADADDVVAAVRFARGAGLPVRVMATGHGAHDAFEGGLLLHLGDLHAVRIDAAARTATFGGGSRWAAVIAAAAEHGLAPVTGSSPTVGATGFLLGGGFGPFARTWGAGSDRLLSLRVVTGEGELVTVSAEEHPDLFWALRGGKGGLGVVVEATVSLLEQSELYGGTAFFDIHDAQSVLEGWLAWSGDADPAVTTSFTIVRFPDLELVPPPLRGRHLLGIRFAAPVDAEEGARLAAPVRALGPVALDGIAPLPIGEVARVSNDPTDPSPAWGRGLMLRSADSDFVRALLGVVGEGATAPFVAVDVRQLGGAAARDVEGGSPVGGRENPYVVLVIGAPDPSLFETVLPGAYAGLHAAIAPWIAPTMTINWLDDPGDPVAFAAAWSPEDRARLDGIRHRYDPAGILPYGPPHQV